MNAVISNAKNPEYGQVTIPFPIPAGQYEHVLDLLDALKIGDTLEQDCQVDELPGCCPILKRLEGSTVNIDELDYLAKRLESFCEGEDAQFQGMATKLGIADIKDFIDLTFCCQEATVITDFSNLDKIGKDHLMTVNGGCMPTAEHDQANCRLAALDLICNHEGYVTPYGVVYDNGMKLDQLYDGRHFPGYYYEPPILALEAVSDEDGFTGLLSLPMPERQLTRMMQRAEAERPDVHLTVTAAQQYQQKLKKAKADYTKAAKELPKWENLMLDSIEGTCVFTPTQIKKRMDAVQATLDELTQQITVLQEQATASAELANELQEQHKRLLSWAEMFNSASPQEKKMVASYIIKAVTLTRGYGIQVEFNISEAQYLGGMEMN